MRTLITLASALFALGLANAQVSIGFRAGISAMRWGYVGAFDAAELASLKSSTEHAVGFTVGVPIEAKLSEKWALQPEFGYIQKGYKHVSSISTNTYVLHLNQLDLSILGKFTLLKGVVQLHAVLGPNVSYGLTVSQRSTDNTSPYANGSVSYDRSNLSIIEASAIAGAGLSFRLGVPRLTLEYRHLHGLTGIVSGTGGRTGATTDAQHRGSIVTLGLLIPLSRSAWQEVK